MKKHNKIDSRLNFAEDNVNISCSELFVQYLRVSGKFCKFCIVHQWCCIFGTKGAVRFEKCLHFAFNFTHRCQKHSLFGKVDNSKVDATPTLYLLTKFHLFWRQTTSILQIRHCSSATSKCYYFPTPFFHVPMKNHQLSCNLKSIEI